MLQYKNIQTWGLFGVINSAVVAVAVSCLQILSVVILIKSWTFQTQGETRLLSGSWPTKLFFLLLILFHCLSVCFITPVLLNVFPRWQYGLPVVPAAWVYCNNFSFMYYIQLIYALLLVGQTIKTNSFKHLIPGFKWACGLWMYDHSCPCWWPKIQKEHSLFIVPLPPGGWQQSSPASC